MFALKANSQQDMLLLILVAIAVYIAFFRRESPKKIQSVYKAASR